MSVQYLNSGVCVCSLSSVMSVQYLNSGVCVFQVDKILKVIPRDRRTFLFSATMTKKVQTHRLCFAVSFSAAFTHSHIQLCLFFPKL